MRRLALLCLACCSIHASWGADLRPEVYVGAKKSLPATYYKACTNMNGDAIDMKIGREDNQYSMVITSGLLNAQGRFKLSKGVPSEPGKVYVKRCGTDSCNHIYPGEVTIFLAPNGHLFGSVYSLNKDFNNILFDAAPGMLNQDLRCGA